MKAIRKLLGGAGSNTAADRAVSQETAADRQRGAPAHNKSPSTPLERLQALNRKKQEALNRDMTAHYYSAGQLLERARRVSLPMQAGSSDDQALKRIKGDIVFVQQEIAARRFDRPENPHISRAEVRARLETAGKALDTFDPPPRNPQER
ncbi:hypothethical protein (plasmid) [Ralstonia solanacearum CMR15]|nr:hypothethical protein [Ralstonia solanacearum CMR15]